MRKFFSLLFALGALTFLAGCGASGGDDEAAGNDTTTTVAPSTTEAIEGTSTTEPPEATTTTTAGSVTGGARDVDSWADDFCLSFQGWLDGLQTSSEAAVEAMREVNLPQGKAGILALLEDVGAQTSDLVTELESNGYPDVTGGEDLVAELIDRFNAFEAAIKTAHTQAETIPTNSPEEFQTQIESVMGAFQDEVTVVGDSFSELDVRYPDPDLQAALLSCDI